jgi:hypothetical protein
MGAEDFKKKFPKLCSLKLQTTPFHFYSDVFDNLFPSCLLINKTDLSFTQFTNFYLMPVKESTRRAFEEFDQKLPENWKEWITILFPNVPNINLNLV